MHRSGTSLVARSLKCLGAELGEAAEWSGPDNPTGFWEHQGVLTINEKVLELCGARWDAPPSDLCQTDQYQRPDLIYLRGAAEHLLRRELDQHPIFAVKDPRLCVLMPFWRPIFDGLGCSVSFIQAIRHPEAVAASLQRRDGMSREVSLSLWLRYNRLAIQERAAQANRSLVVDYDIMMAQPAAELSRLAARLDLALDRQEGRRFVSEFMDESLWHEPAEADLPMEVDILWQQLRSEATKP
jgi:hypothetical protein